MSTESGESTGSTESGSGTDGDTDAPTPVLAALAERYGIATSYWSFFGEQVQVPASTLRAMLTAMDVNAGTDAAAAAALTEADDRPWRELVPPSLVMRQGSGTLAVHVEDGHDVSLSITLEDGSLRDMPIPPQQPTQRTIDGTTRWQLQVPLPGDLPLGWHSIRATQRRHGMGDTDGTPDTDRTADADRTADTVLVIAPGTLAPPPTRPDHHGRAWGLMAQLYSVRSRASWGIGDFADLADLASIAGGRGADFLLINPVHAAGVTSPLEPSPYLPATRRFLAPLYVRPEDIREAAYLPASDRARLEAARATVATADTDAERIDRDAAWAAKRVALESVFEVPRTPARQGLLDDFVAREGRPLQDFALWCALDEHFGGDAWPDEALDLTSRLVADLRTTLTDRIAFHAWLQWIADEQLAAAEAAAAASGMRIGIMHDLAVGVHTRGSDAWSLRDMYAPGITVGAPPDMYNQQGQNWNQPPWRPHALAESGYAQLRDMIRTLLRHAGALRIDHIIGFFRLWWIPAELGPTRGTYVRYDHEAMISVLALEAHRAGAVVIGEDLGNVEPWVRDYLSSRGILGTSVLWFEYENGALTPPEHYRRAVLATVNTHDLPPTAGYLAGEHVDLRARLGLLTEPVEQARAEAAAERESILRILRDRGLIGADATEQQIVEALHLHLVASPSELLGVALVDAVGERRVQNQPGTENEYPNWRVPLADSTGTAVLLDDLAHTERFVSLTDAVDAALRR